MTMPRLQIPSACELGPDGLILKLDLVVPSDVGVIDNLVMRIADLLQGAPCATELEAIGLALREALANAIVHGNRNNASMTRSPDDGAFRTVPGTFQFGVRLSIWHAAQDADVEAKR